jgi:hypothetical protein
MNSAATEKKGKGKLIFIFVAVAFFLFLIPTCGVFVAIAVPALAAAREDARAALSQNILVGAEKAKANYSQSTGRAPKTWNDISSYLVLKGQRKASAAQFMQDALGGGILKIRGIDGANETLIVMPGGQEVRLISPNGNRNRPSSGYSQ